MITFYKKYFFIFTVSFVSIFSLIFFQNTFAFSGEKSDDLKLLESKEIFNPSDKDAIFFPDQYTNRGEFLQWTLRNTGFSEINFKTGKEPFSDINKKDDLFSFVASSWESGALEAYENKTKFLPKKKISRLEAMKILFAIEGISTFQNYQRSFAQWKDLPINKQDRAVIIKAIDLGYLKKTKDGYISPKKKLTKGEVVYFLARIQRAKAKKIKTTRSKKSIVEISQNIILNNALKKNTLTKDALEEDAIQGMMQSLNDKYSVYFPPEQAKNFNTYIKGGDRESKYAGIGVSVVQSKTGSLIITEIFNGPAKKVRLQEGDEIIKVNNENITQLKTTEITDKIKGVIGTPVSLTIKRGAKEFTQSLIRDEVVIENFGTVDSSIDNNILFIKVRAFKANTARDFKRALENNISKNTKGLIIDLRYNSGGLLRASQEMLGELLPKKHLTVRMKTIETEKKIEVSGSGNFTGIPLVVLQNEYSASASEIFSGSIQDYKRGVIIGKTSFGKGIAQNLYSLSNGGSIKLTTSEFFTPLGNTVHHQGITPDVLVEKLDTKSLMKVAKQYLR